MHTKPITAVLLSAVLFVVTVVEVHAEVSFTALGDIPGGTFDSRVFGISSDGSTVVGMSDSALGLEAFRWTAQFGMQGLGDLPGGSFQSSASDISSDGQVIVGYGANDQNQLEAMRVGQDGTMIGLGRLPNGTGVQGTADGVSADGSVIVGSASNQFGDRESFRWTEESGMVGLGDLPGADFYSFASGVSDDGSVIVGVATDAAGMGIPGNRAFRWTEETGMQALESDAFLSMASGVSGDGRVVIGYDVVPGVAWRWTEEEGMQKLGTLNGVGTMAVDCTPDGSVILGRTINFPDLFIWTEEQGMQSVTTLLTDAGVLQSGWQLLHAGGISDDGLTIAGYGRNPDGNREAFVATIPEPTTIALLALGGLAILRKRK